MISTSAAGAAKHVLIRNSFPSTSTSNAAATVAVTSNATNTTKTHVKNAMVGRDGMVNRMLYLGQQQQKQQQQQRAQQYYHSYATTTRRPHRIIKEGEISWRRQFHSKNILNNNNNNASYHYISKRIIRRPTLTSRRHYSSSIVRPPSNYFRPLSSSSLLLASLAAGTTVIQNNNNNDSKTNCSAAVVATEPIIEAKTSWQKLKEKGRKALRMFARFVKLCATLAPMILLYPLLASSETKKVEDLHWFTKLYLRWCLRNVEWSGAAVIKLMQWLSSRPDLVGDQFCSVFSSLQDSTTPHAWHHTVEAMEEAYGKNWQELIRLEQEPIGSGCIGQVYKGRIMNNKKNDNNSDDDNSKVVAVKVLHPDIDKDIETDLDWLRLMADLITKVSKPLSWLNPTGAVDEFGRMLRNQLDLREEALNLTEFNKMFESETDYLIFPTVENKFPPTNKVLVESYIEGTPILEYAKQHASNFKLLHQICVTGIKVVCKMIFIHNRSHGDLHPGNILITPDEKMAILDCGIVNTYSPEDHGLIVNILTAFIRHDGEGAGRLLLQHNNLSSRTTQKLQRQNSMALGIDEAGFVAKINHMAKRAQSKEEQLMEKLGEYISMICDAAATHHVLMNQSFVSAALTIKVQEGIVLALDPHLEIWTVANPIILEGEAIRRAKDLMHRIKGDKKDNNDDDPSSPDVPWNLLWDLFPFKWWE